MKFLNIRSLFFVGVLLSVGLVGMSQTALAQGNSRWAHEKNRIRKEEKRWEKERKREAKRYRVYRNGSYYETDHRGAELLRQAVNAGYQRGYRQGQIDSRYGRSGGYYGSDIYRSGSYGYRSYVDRNQYQYYFQQGFQRGYEDGYNSRLRYGYRSGSSYNILGAILNSILNIRQY